MTELINGTAITYVADKLGVAVQQMFVAYTGAQVGFGVLTSIVYLLFGACLSIGTFLIYRKINKTEYTDNDEKYIDFIIKEIILLIGSIILCFIAWKIGTAVLHIYYPQYFAIQDMLGTFGQATG